ncbi:MAG: hypothetical protein HC808_13480 [Candidatus Competibacteraceae bacterium]|nr:hypothetical protein [Candidatus Competibacteraceae bacterium]
MNIKEFTLRDPNGKLALKTTATVGFADLDFTVDGQWQALAWPLTAPPQVESPTGQFNAKGNPKDYQLQLQAKLTSTEAGPLKAALEAAGTDQTSEAEQTIVAVRWRRVGAQCPGRIRLYRSAIHR